MVGEMSGLVDESLINDFVDESLAHLESIEPDLLQMENGEAASEETINRIFRAIHSIKGSSGMLELDSIKKLSHVMENLFMKIRDGAMSPNPEIIDALLKGVDKLRLMIESVDSCGLIPIDEEIAALNVFLGIEIKAVASNARAQSNAEESKLSLVGNILTVKGNSPLNPFSLEIDLHKVLEAASSEEVQALWVRNAADLVDKGRTLEQFIENAETLGSFLATDVEGGQGREVFHFLYSTVMDVDFTQTAFDLPMEQIVALSLDDLETAQKNEASSSTQAEAQPLAAPVKNHPELAGKPKEENISKKINKAVQNETIRVNVELLDRLMNLAGELVLGRNQLRSEFEKTKNLNPKINSLMQQVGRFTTEIQEDIMRMRMQPVGNVLNKFPRVIRDLCRQLQKEAELVLEGGEVELDKSILEGLSDPLTHLIRNCVDHGIESPGERENAGKPRTGLIRIKAFHEGGQVNLVVIDDGHGIDAEAVAEKAQSKGLVSSAELAKMSAKEKLSLILLPGLSTAKKVTDVSGRGVGMDVVKTNIEKLGGHLELESELGKGSTVRLRLPLTLAIVPSIILGVADHCFAVPQVNVKEMVCIRAGDVAARISKIGNAEILRLRGSLLPLAKLSVVLGLDAKFTDPVADEHKLDRRKRLSDRRGPPLADEMVEVCEETSAFDRRIETGEDRRTGGAKDVNIIILRVGTSRFGLVVDELFDNEEIVVKPLSEHIKSCKCFSGATIMGDGRVAMILDAAGIAASAEMHFSENDLIKIKELEEKDAKALAGNSMKQSIIIFNNALDEYFALPLAGISRLEKIMSESIKKVGEREYVLSHGHPTPIARLENFLPVSVAPPNLEEIYLIIPKTLGPRVGIAASRVFDTVDADVTIEKDICVNKMFLGSAVVAGQLTTFLNPDELVAAMAKTAFSEKEYSMAGIEPAAVDEAKDLRA